MSTSVDANRVLQALGDATRRAIIERLAQQPASVSALAAPLNISLTAVTQHLQVLETSGLVHTEKRGRVRTCRLDPAGFLVLENWIRNCRSAWQRRLDRLEDLLGEDDR
ncbi:MAG: metalloregulator ArsR/SmtB family transcription factor [Acidobacteriota bacterium]|nr:metalloregulator ArsR/SmtB family transcription factor [Acidobacteriota bacterium]